ncbi:MAG TPA: extracellular solute-binding protein [Chthonomonadaceae bacterium]|nr:extracellular solute-binding protein [Chthonomonadaceae bacterium]
MLLFASLRTAETEPTLHFWAVTGSVKDVQMYRTLADNFERRTGIKVEITPLAWGNFATKYFTAMAAGLPPDIGVTNLGGPFDYGSVGGLVDLRAEFKEGMPELEREFSPEVLRMFTLGDKLFGVPADLSTLTLYYRTDIFRKLDLPSPKTWSELNRVISRLEANDYRFYFGFTAGAQWADELYTMPYGLPRFQQDATGAIVCNWNDPRYQKGILEALQLWYMHNSPGQELGPRILGMFRSDEPGVAVPLMADIHTVAGQIAQSAPELKGKWAAIPWPKADDGRAHNVMGGTSYVIFRKSRLKKEAFAWLRYLNTLEAQQAMILDKEQRGDESALMISPVLSVWKPESDAFWSRPEMSAEAEMHRVLTDVMPTFATTPAIHGAVEANRLEANLLDQMATFIRDHMDELASRNHITRTELVRRFGAGTMERERLALEDTIAAHLKQEYAAIAPQAVALLRSETARYEERYGIIIADLPDYEQRRSVLDTVKWGVGLAALLLVALVVALPRYRRHYTSYLFVGLPLLRAITFVFIPAITALYLSFTDYHPVLPLSTARWVGTQNYTEVVRSGDLLASIGRTVRYALGTLPIGIVFALVFAYLLNSRLRGERYWRFLYFSPLVTSVVSIALIFSQLFLSGPQGWLNSLLLHLNLIRDPIPFLTSEHTFLNCVILLAIWHGLAFTILVFLAGLQQIPTQLYEAAAVDGAGPVRQFWHIAIPGLRVQIFFVAVLGMIGAFQVFETIYTLAGKSGDAGARFGPNDSALTMVPLIYHTGFETFEMGKSTAIAYVLFALILGLTAIQFRYYRKRGA